jgi:hypothetical protein
MWKGRHDSCILAHVDVEVVAGEGHWLGRLYFDDMHRSDGFSRSHSYPYLPFATFELQF